MNLSPERLEDESFEDYKNRRDYNNQKPQFKYIWVSERDGTRVVRQNQIRGKAQKKQQKRLNRLNRNEQN